MAVRSKRAAGKKIASRKKSAGEPARYDPNFGRADPSPATGTETSPRGGKGAAKKALAKVKKTTAKKTTAKKTTAKKTSRAKKS
jgi:hypothetical protein